MLQKLSAAAINRKAEFRKPGRYADGGGLYLQVTAKQGGDGFTRAWLFQYSIKGKVRQMGLGSFELVSLSQARKRADAARDKVADGVDPITEKNAERRAAAIEVALPQTSKHSRPNMSRRTRPLGAMRYTASSGLRPSRLTFIRSSAR